MSVVILILRFTNCADKLTRCAKILKHNAKQDIAGCLCRKDKEAKT